MQALQQTLIEFDPFAQPKHPGLLALATPPERLSLKPIPWPRGLAPKPDARIPGPSSSPLPRCDVLIVTWTVAEAEALSQVLTPGHFSNSDWKSYTHKYASYLCKVTGPHAPIRNSKRLGSYRISMIGSKKVLCFKSELHLAEDGPAMPVADLMAQITAEARPSLLITTGTAGGVGKDMALGDVVASGDVAADCQREFKSKLGSRRAALPALDAREYAVRLARANLGSLPGPKRSIRVVFRPHTQTRDGIVTTDFFAFDTSTNRYGLKRKAVEIGDVVIALMCSRTGRSAPKFVAIRKEVASVGRDPFAHRTSFVERISRDRAA